MPSDVHIVLADLGLAGHAAAVRALTDAYARDPMGNAGPLPQAVLEALVPGLRGHPGTHVLLAFRGDAPVGIATCFLGFSTFAARPLLNVHDLAVIPGERGRGIGRRLLAAAEEHARGLGCCKLTMEVLADNPARRLYERAGFTHEVHGTSAGGSLFYVKSLTASSRP